MEKPKNLRERIANLRNDIIYGWSWTIPLGVFRLLYGYRAIGMENIPNDDAFILAVNEWGLPATLVDGWLSVKVIMQRHETHPNAMLSYLQEELWRFKFFQRRSHRDKESRGHYRPLVPQGAGKLALGLMDGYKMLRDGGVVVMNPEGDMTWDGRPLPLGTGMAWLALHTGAPVVPALCTVGIYDIWPRWRRLPSLRGHMTMRVGKPIKVTDVPLAQVSDADIAAANAKFRAEFDRIRYDADGPEGWAGPVTRNGKPVSLPFSFPPTVQPANPEAAGSNRSLPSSRRGVARLLWQCPVCRTSNSLIHRKPLFRRETVHCGACGALWTMRRVIARDFRITLVSGPAEWVGLEMGVSDWYAQIKRRFQATPIATPDGVTLRPGEETYLVAPDAELLPYRPNPIFDGYTGREPPRIQPPGKRAYAAWDSIGKGRLVLTDRRLLWQGPQGELDFWWDEITAVMLWMDNVIVIHYGSASYRFGLGDQMGLEWLANAREFARAAAARTGRELVTSSV